MKKIFNEKLNKQMRKTTWEKWAIQGTEICTHAYILEWKTSISLDKEQYTM